MARTSSSRVIQLQYCRPEPSGPPSPSRTSGQHSRHAPPRARKHQAGAQRHHPDAGRSAPALRLPPTPHDLAEEPGAQRPSSVSSSSPRSP